MKNGWLSQALRQRGWMASGLSERLGFLDVSSVNKHTWSIRLTENPSAGLIMITLGTTRLWVAPNGTDQEETFCELIDDQKFDLSAATLDSFVSTLRAAGIKAYTEYPGS